MTNLSGTRAFQLFLLTVPALFLLAGCDLFQRKGAETGDITEGDPLNPFFEEVDQTPTVSVPFPAAPTGEAEVLARQLVSQGNYGRFEVGQPYMVSGVRYVPADSPGLTENGSVEVLSAHFDGRPSVSGEPFDSRKLTASHKTLPFSALVRLTNLANNRSTVVRVIDRGPFRPGYVMDISEAAAQELGIVGAGEVSLEYLSQASRVLAELTATGNVSSAPAQLPTATFGSAVTTTPIPQVPSSLPPINQNPAQIVASQPPIPSPTPPPASAEPYRGGYVENSPQIPAAQAPVPTPASQAAPLAAASGWYIDAGTFSTTAAVRSMESRLSALGQTQVVASGAGQKILVGPFASQQNATAVLGQVIGEGAYDAQVVQRS